MQGYQKYWQENDREDFVCPECGQTADEVEEIHVHHRNGMHYDNRMENLVAVCAQCHGHLHREMDSGVTVDDWKDHFRESLINE